MRQISISFALAAFVAVSVADAAETPTPFPAPAALEAGLAGRWHGALGYRDYQSNELFELAVDTDIRAVADGVTVIRVSTFDEGPGKTPVYITTASLFVAVTGTVAETTLRMGRPVEVATDRVIIVGYTDAAHWTMRYERDGIDGGKPAKLRSTETRDGDAMLTVKEVIPATAADGIWRFRNQTRLKRQP